jgi:hypothetical protein
MTAEDDERSIGEPIRESHVGAIERLTSLGEQCLDADEWQRVIRERAIWDTLSDLPSPEYATEADFATWLTTLDPSTPEGQVDLLSEIARVLAALGEPRPEVQRMLDTAQQELRLVISAQPEWLDPPSDDVRELLGQVRTLPSESRSEALRNRFEERFTYLTHPPRWIQDPAEWPSIAGSPLVFVGQLDVSPLSHDVSDLFVFLDPRTGGVTTITQSM